MVTPPDASTTHTRTGLKPVLGFRDLVVFYVIVVIGLRLVPVAASVGPSVIALWIIALLSFCVPLVLTVTDLSSRFPNEGGIYVWSKRAFGDFHGFITAWTYWTANLAYFPSVLLFAASQSAFVFPTYSQLADDTGFLLSFSLAAIALVFMINIVGLRVATWFHGLTVIARLLPAAIIIVLGVYAYATYGSATDFSPGNWVPSVTRLSDLFLLSTLAYLFAGFESASTLGDEIENPRRNIPRALLTTGLIVTFTYIAMSLCFMILVPASEIDGLQGFAAAVGAGATHVGGENFGAFVTSITSALLAFTLLGTVSVWFATAARLPFVIGLDHYLPPAFCLVSKRFNTPWVSCLVLAAATALVMWTSTLGGRAAQIYNILISIEIVVYFIPNLYLFAALLKLHGEDSSENAIRVPGGKFGTMLVGGMGFFVTAMSLIFALIPGEDIESMWAFYGSISVALALNLGLGASLYFFGRRRWARAPSSA